MRVLYEGGMFYLQRWGGIQRYHVSLINHLPESCRSLLVVPKRRGQGVTNPHCDVRHVRTSAPVKQLARAWRKFQSHRLAQLCNHQQADVEHWTYYTGLCGREITRTDRPLVITVHDFIHEAYPFEDPDSFHRQSKRRAIDAADAILCVSNFTHQQLCEFHPAAVSKATVVHHGNSMSQVTSGSLPPELQNRRFALFVGRRDGYKNFDLLYQAWNRQYSRTGMALAVVGTNWQPHERSFVDQHDPDDLVLVADTDDATLKALYQSCACYVFPTRMEGFGLPAIEAMGCAAPMLLSECDALREVAGESAHYFDPDDLDALTDMLQLASDDRLPRQAEKTALGIEQAATFRWERAAAETVQIYRNVCSDTNSRRQAA